MKSKRRLNKKRKSRKFKGGKLSEETKNNIIQYIKDNNLNVNTDPTVLGTLFANLGISIPDRFEALAVFYNTVRNS
jgi:hypothetical protein